MRILLSTYGNRGDVQPFVALASALKGRGHEVALCTPTGFRGMVERHGVPYAHMGNAVLELTEAVLRAPTGAEQRRLFKGFGAVIRAGLEDEWRAAQALRPDLLVYHSKALGSRHIAEKLGAAELLAMPLPLTRTRAFPVPLIPDLGLGGWFNALSYRLLALGNALWAGATNDFRVKTLGLPPLPRFVTGRPTRKPTVICPFLGDQPLWGRVVQRAGLGSAPVPQKSLTPQRLAEAIRAALAPAVVARAAAVGERIRLEDGPTRAAELIEATQARPTTARALP